MDLLRVFPLSDWAKNLTMRIFYRACRNAAQAFWHFQLLTHHYIARRTLESRKDHFSSKVNQAFSKGEWSPTEFERLIFSSLVIDLNSRKNRRLKSHLRFHKKRVLQSNSSCRSAVNYVLFQRHLYLENSCYPDIITLRRSKWTLAIWQFLISVKKDQSSRFLRMVETRCV